MYQRAQEFSDLGKSFVEQLDYTLKKKETKLIGEALEIASQHSPMTDAEYSGPWSEEDNRLARLEGWEIRQNGSSPYRYLKICQYDPKVCRPAFMTNADAEIFVRWRAAHVSPLHCKAARIAREAREAWQEARNEKRASARSRIS